MTQTGNVTPVPQGPPPTTRGDRQPTGELTRSLTHRQTTMIGLGCALGTGLFLGSGSAIGTAGPAVILSYIAGAVLVAIIARVLGAMTIVHPVRGTFGTIAHLYLGPWAGFLVRWLFWAGTTVAIGGEVVAAAIYIRYWWPQAPMLLLIAAVAALVLGVNIVSVRSFGLAEFWLSSVKVTAVVVFIAAGLLLVFVGLPHTPAAGLGNLTSDGGFFPHGPQAVWAALSVVMFAFVGFETTSISAAETTDPTRSIRTAMRALVWRLGLFYILSIGIIVTLVPWRDTAGGDGSITGSPFVRVFSQIGIPAAASLTNAIVLIAAISSANAQLYAASRFLHSLGHDRCAPAVLARVDTRGVPVRALVVSAAGIVAAALLAAFGVDSVFNVLVSVAIFSVLLVWLLILASYLAFRRSDAPATGQGLRVWGGAWTAWAGIAGVLAVAATAAVVPVMAQAAWVGTGFTLALLLVYALRVRHVVNRHTRAAPSEEAVDA
ncbi:AAT family amino acid transporter [Streptomyces achromogenes]|uniref:amino acid permease n=1 Tax=Streptomyces achromogenes TaxID=67255 RepID=UPI00277DB743|nr:amino acid permease [Streptomyces achromogenes]MDQ0829185.1 AAT family amino acid transporter [Streptomyces achromogenes]